MNTLKFHPIIDTIKRIIDICLPEFKDCVFLRGGAIRDAILGIESFGDIDLVIFSDKYGLDGGRVFSDKIDYFIGTDTGVKIIDFWLCKFDIEGVHVDVCTPYKRENGEIVYNHSIEEYVNGVDFTINSAMYNISTGELCCERAKQAISEGVIAPINKPTPHRMLRAVRFHAVLGLSIDSDLYNVIKANSHLVKDVIGSTIGSELMKVMVHPVEVIIKYINTLHETGLLKWISKDMDDTFTTRQNRHHGYNTVWEHTTNVLRELPDNASVELKIAALLHDIGKPSTLGYKTIGDLQNEPTFYGHDKRGGIITLNLLQRLCAPESLVNNVSTAISAHMTYPKLCELRDHKKIRFYHTYNKQLGIISKLCECDGRSKPNKDLSKLTDSKNTVDYIRYMINKLGIDVNSDLDDKSLNDVSRKVFDIRFESLPEAPTPPCLSCDECDNSPSCHRLETCDRLNSYLIENKIYNCVKTALKLKLNSW